MKILLHYFFLKGVKAGRTQLLFKHSSAKFSKAHWLAIHLIAHGNKFVKPRYFMDLTGFATHKHAIINESFT